MSVAARVPRFRLVATDLDGTILRADGTVSPRVRRALADVARAGALVVIATARTPRWIPTGLRAIADSGLLICANGALVAKTRPWRVVDQTLVPTNDARSVIAAVRRARPSSAFAIEYPGGAEREAAFAGSRAPESGPVTERLAPDQPALKILIQDRALDIACLASTVRMVVPTTVHVTSSGLSHTVEVGPAAVSKAAALRGISAQRGIPAAAVLAFGDMPNDAEMLSWVGWGVAVGNADPRLLDLADEVTASVDDDGVAIVLERLFSALS